MNYKHWGKRYNPAEESICSAPGCMRGGVDFEQGRVKCSNHLTLRLEVTNARHSTHGLPVLRRMGQHD